MVKILNSACVKEEPQQLSNKATQLGSEERTMLLCLFEYFEDLFYGTLGEWATGNTNLELKPGSKPFNSRYYPVPRIDKKTLRKEL